MPEQPKDLSSWLDYIGQQHSEVIDMGLERFSQVQYSLNLKQPAPRVITVAGTNGKGSTARVIEALLLDAGYSVGTTLSPHVWRFNERIRIDGKEADDAAICNAFAAVDDARGDLPLTYFEFSALAALFCMARSQVDFAILEIGLGGRLDAFNAVDADVAVITSIGLDHQAFLGDTREAIGGEKAGILRAGQRVVLGQNMPESVYARCRTLDLTPNCWGEDFSSLEDFSNLNGNRQWVYSRADREAITVPQTRLAAHNIAVACEAVAGDVELNRERILRCADLAIPGRMDFREADDRVWVHDVCHNPDGADFFMGELAARGITPSFFICAMLAGKDHLSFVKAINNKSLSGTPWAFVDSHGDRQLAGEDLADTVGLPDAGVGDMRQAIGLAKAETGPGDVIVIFGSFNAVEQSPWLA